MFKSKKLLVSLVAIVAIVLLVVLRTDFEVLKWVGGFIMGIAGSFSLGQGFADGMSQGRTSAGS